MGYIGVITHLLTIYYLPETSKYRIQCLQNPRGICDVETAMATGRVQGAGHAGCFVRRGNQMLAVRLTYDGHWDIVGHDFSVC